MKEKEQGAQERQKSKQELHIHIERWQDIVDVLDDNKKVFRLVLVVVIIGLALFAGISFIAIQLKKAYTYSDITTNALGATTLKDEQKEVSYFLFNTATLWANSGISVEKGDVISVYSSGTAHTAIHHLHKDAGENRQPDEDFFDADGDRFSLVRDRDRARRKFRMIPYLPNNALVMQVYDGNGRPPMKVDESHKEARENFYFVAQHRENIIINEGGKLFFAINDIVLDSNTIRQMKDTCYGYMLDTVKNQDDTLKKYHKFIASIRARDKSRKGKLTREEAYLPRDSADIFRKCMKRSIYQFGVYFDEDKDVKKPDSCTFKTEMDYYLEHNYQRAWFDDNVGSFLIIVEKNYRK